MSKEVAISVKGLSKNFILPHQKKSSVKSVFTSMLSFGDKSFEVQHALKDIDFEIKKGEFFGIVGRNGSGKSTLLKILAHIYQPTKGSVEVEGRIVPFIELGVGFNGELSGRENVYLNGALLGFSEKEVNNKYQDIVNFAEIERFMDQKLKNYSSGMQVRLAFSVATVLAESDILLIDEVLAVGDADFQRKCFDFFRGIKKQGKTVVFVTHDMNAVREYCDRAMLIEKSKVVVIGDPDKVASKYSRMFLEEKTSKSKSKDGKADRWGDGKAKYNSVIAKVIENGKRIQITCEIMFNEEIVNPIAGFLVRNASGQALLGTNSQILNTKITNVKPGGKKIVTWSFENIFNDGNYFIEPAIVYNNGTDTADCWGEAASFEVLKETRTPYPINPEINIKVK